MVIGSRETLQNLATRIWTAYFEAESMNPEKGVHDALQMLRVLSSSLTAIANGPPKDSASQVDQEEKINDLLREIVSKLAEKDSISTFEFVESGIITALVHYLACDSHLVGEDDSIASKNLEKRFEAFGLLLLSRASSCQEFPVLTLLRRLQSALSSMENFPIISSYAPKIRHAYATVPFGRSTMYQCLKVQFLKENGENSLCDSDGGVVPVDPFLPLNEVERYLWSRVNNGKKINLNVDPTNSTEIDKYVESAELTIYHAVVKLLPGSYINRSWFHFTSRERTCAFAEGRQMIWIS